MKKRILTMFMFLLVLCVSGVMGVSLQTFAVEETKPKVEKINIVSEQMLVDTLKNPLTYNNTNIELILNKNLNLMNNTEDFRAINKDKHVFKGVFNGNGYVIDNLPLCSSTQYYGLFPYADGAVIKDLKITGDVIVDIKPEDINTKCVGILVGYGQNVQIHKCELENIKIIEEQEIQKTSVNFDVKSNLVFGGLVGKLQTIAGKTNVSEIVDCISYYDVNLTFNKNVNLKVGGIVGEISSGSKVVNCINYGNINLVNNIKFIEKNFLQSIGGIAGEVTGEAKILNTCLAGNVLIKDDFGSLKAEYGAIVGTITGINPIVNYGYWGQDEIYSTGGDKPLISDFLKKVDTGINKDLLLAVEKFDKVEKSWDFEKVYGIFNSSIHLQRFQTFKYSFKPILDKDKVLKSAVFKVNEEEEGQASYTVKYGEKLFIHLLINEKFYTYYKISVVKCNGTNLNDLISNGYTINTLVNENNVVIGYDIFVDVNDATDGVYNFDMIEIDYKCQAKVSQSAIDNEEGGVKKTDSQYNPKALQELTFTHKSKVEKISAVGNGIYSFDYWQILYKDEDGNFTVVLEEFEGYQNSTISIHFGTEPFNKEFQLVAYFTSKNAVSVQFDELDMEKQIKSLKFAETDYTNEAIRVSPNEQVVLEIITNKNYTIDLVKFEEYMQKLYGENSIETLLAQDPIKNDTTGETTYVFNINMKSFVEIVDKSLSLSIPIIDSSAKMDKTSLALTIVIPSVAVIVIVALTIILVKRRKGHGGKGASSKQKEKKDSYKDYYI